MTWLWHNDFGFGSLCHASQSHQTKILHLEMLLLADLLRDIVAVLVRFIITLLLLNGHASFFRHLLAVLVGHLVALGVLLLHLADLLDGDTLGLGQVLAGFRNVSPDLVIVAL